MHARYNGDMTFPASSAATDAPPSALEQQGGRNVAVLRRARWRLGIALALVFGLALANLIVGLAAGAPFNNSLARELAGSSATGARFLTLAGAVFFALGLIAVLGRRSPGAFYLAAVLFAGVTFKQVVDVAAAARQGGGGDGDAALVNTAGLLLRLVVFVPLIAGGAGALKRLQTTRPDAPATAATTVGETKP